MFSALLWARVLRLACVCCGVGIGLLLPCSGALAQGINGQGGEELRLLNEAATREAVGDLTGAEQILRTILDDRPNSIAAVLAFEKVLRAQGRLEVLLPVVERMLEEDPSSAIGHQLRVRSLSELGRVSDLEAAMEAWIQATPKLETPYREAAAVWMARGEPAKALKLLERGRSRVGRRDALALEMGDAALALGDLTRAVREWDLAIGKDAGGFNLVRRRLTAAPDGGAKLIPALVDALAGSSSTPARRRAATGLAIEAGLGEKAERIARDLVSALEPRERQGFLVEVARRADGAKLPSLAYWAYASLLEDGPAGRPQHAIRGRLGDLALQLGDTAAARVHFQAVEAAFAEDSPERRQAMALRIELSARSGQLDEVVGELAQFRRTYPDAPELDALAGAVADRLVSQDDISGAESILAGVSGPRSSLVRSRIALLRGDLPGARSQLRAAAPRLQGLEATEAIALSVLLGRLTAAGGGVVADAMARIAAGDVADGVAALAEGSAGLEAGERAAVLDFAAGVADRAGLSVEAERIRRTIVSEMPDSQEAPRALLALGRALIDRPGGLEEARAFLERLVLDYPKSALVPQARRELDRLQGRVGSL